MFLNVSSALLKVENAQLVELASTCQRILMATRVESAKDVMISLSSAVNVSKVGAGNVWKT